MKLTVPQDEYDEIRAVIQEPKSPVGIDATKTHVLILHKLLEIERRLERLERTAGPRR